MSMTVMRILASVLFIAMMFGWSKLLHYVDHEYGTMGLVLTVVAGLSLGLLLVKALGGSIA
jgi:hypothetical protein